MNATLETANGLPVLRFERRLAHSPEKVWKAITDPAELARLVPARRAGHVRARVQAPVRLPRRAAGP